MLIPFFSKNKKSLYRRKGGGGKGGSSGGSSSGGSKGGTSSGGGTSSSGGGSSGTTKSTPISGSTGTGKSSNTATTYGSGGGRATTIPSGQLFSGRSAGGYDRSSIYGGRYYGSGYPGYAGRGVYGRGFPFFFWPVVFGTGLGYGANSYLHNDTEYGTPNNSSRPGGIEYQGPVTSTDTNSTFFLIADNSTVVALLDAINMNCTAFANFTLGSATPYDGSVVGSPQPESAIQYYRASSIVLTLNGYNNTAALSNNDSVPDTPLPATVDGYLLECLNSTIGLAAPLIDSAGSRWAAPGAGTLALVWVLGSIAGLV